MAGFIFKIVTSASILGLTTTNAQNCTLDALKATKDLEWCSCYENFLCAKLDVPLDYQRPSLGRASVPLIKVPAKSTSTDGPYQGMILVNPGGPGASGVDMARYNGTLIQGIVGSNFDIIGFDNRGMHLAEPLANCSLGVPTTPARSIEARSPPRLADQYYNSFIGYGKRLGKQCQKLTGDERDAGPHMSTATNARDMLSIVDAYANTEDGKRAAKPSKLLNYYGISYGTFLGQTFASLFPNRVGNVAVDGLVSPEAYIANFTASAINHLDGILALFFVYCNKAGNSTCPYHTGSTPKDIFNRFNASFVQLDARKAESAGWKNASDIQGGLLALKVGVLGAANAPITGFRPFADALLSLESALESNTLPEWTRQMYAIMGDPTVNGYVNPEWTLGVLCSDQKNKFYGKGIRAMRPLIKQLEAQSIVGEVWTHSVLACTGWPIKSNDVFQGPWGGNTKTPMLFVSNTYDPVTPIENSISAAPKYKNARILRTDGMGHTTSATNNICAFGTLRAYFQATILPTADKFCPLERGPFGVQLEGTLEQNIQQAGLDTLNW